MLLNLLIAAPNHLIIDDQTAATQLRENAIGQLSEPFAHVSDLLFALLWVFIHRQHTQNHVLILDVAGLNELHKALPVLRGVVRIDVSLHLVAFELLLHIALTYVLTLVG